MGPLTPYDSLPAAVRRENWGWFGEPWPSGICYGGDGVLLEDMRKPFPAGESCLYCDVALDEAAGDSGQAMPVSTRGGPGIAHAHKECLLRQVTGPVAHLEGRCSCAGGTGRDDPGRTRREEALAVWAWVREHGPAAL